MNKQQAIERIKTDFYKATEVFAELAAAGRIEVPEGHSVEEVRRGMSEHAAELIEDHWVSFDPPAADDDELDGDPGATGDGDDESGD